MSQTFSANEIIFLSMLKIKMVLCAHDALLQEVQGLPGCLPPAKNCQGSNSLVYMFHDLSWVPLAAGLCLTPVS